MTVEAVLWFPLYFFSLVMVADASAIMMNQSRILQAIQDGNRMYVTDAIATRDGVEDWIESRVSGFAPNAAATSATTSGILETVVIVPASDLDLSGVSGFFSGLTITVRSQHLEQV